MLNENSLFIVRPVVLMTGKMILMTGAF